MIHVLRGATQAAQTLPSAMPLRPLDPGHLHLMVKKCSYDTITILAYISNEHSFHGGCFPKRCKIGSNSTSRDAQLYKACCLVCQELNHVILCTKVQTQPVAIQAGGLDQTIHPQDLEEFSH